MTRTPTPAASRQKERSDTSTKRLLDAAGELIVVGGYSAMTLAAVGESAGYSRGLVTARFGSKDKLLEALIERIVNRWNYRNLLPARAGKSGRDQIVTFLRAVERQADTDPRALRVLYALMFEALGPIPELRDRFAEFHREMRSDMAQLVRSGIRDKSINRRVQPDREAEMIVGSLRGIAYQWKLDPEQFDPVPALAYLAVSTEIRLSP